jgi:(p)ppGpp synthase/HD superfamily hydrolase
MTLSERFEQALLYAIHLHARQTRKGTNIPYVSHLLGVASLVMEDGGSEDEVIAALLHDAVEDQGGKKTLDEIRERFGSHVADIVEGCTDSFRFPKFTWKSRKETQLKKLSQASQAIIRVSLADKFHNICAITRDLRNIGNSVWDRFNCRPDEMVWYYNQLLVIFQVKSNSPLVKELSIKVNELNQLLINIS